MVGKFDSNMIPQVTRLPGQKKVAPAKGFSEKGADPSEFKNLLKSEIKGMDQQHGLSLSLHAAKRLKERNIEMDNNEILALKNAMNQLKAKGGQDSLVVTKKGAYIIDVNNSKIVTALDRGSVNQNIFTKIDSTLILE